MNESLVARPKQPLKRSPYHDCPQQQQQQQQPPKTHPREQHFTCLYTKQKTQKRKIWKDGKLTLSLTSGCIQLYDTSRTSCITTSTSSTQVPMEETIVALEEIQNISNGTIQEIDMETCCVQIVGPATTNATTTTTTTTMTRNHHPIQMQQQDRKQKLLQQKFRLPIKVTPCSSSSNPPPSWTDDSHGASQQDDSNPNHPCKKRNLLWESSGFSRAEEKDSPPKIHFPPMNTIHGILEQHSQERGLPRQEMERHVKQNLEKNYEIQYDPDNNRKNPSNYGMNESHSYSPLKNLNPRSVFSKNEFHPSQYYGSEEEEEDDESNQEHDKEREIMDNDYKREHLAEENDDNEEDTNPHKRDPNRNHAMTNTIFFPNPSTMTHTKNSVDQYPSKKSVESTTPFNDAISLPQNRLATVSKHQLLAMFGAGASSTSSTFSHRTTTENPLPIHPTNIPTQDKNVPTADDNDEKEEEYTMIPTRNNSNRNGYSDHECKPLQDDDQGDNDCEQSDDENHDHNDSSENENSDDDSTESVMKWTIDGVWNHEQQA